MAFRCFWQQFTYRMCYCEAWAHHSHYKYLSLADPSPGMGITNKWAHNMWCSDCYYNEVICQCSPHTKKAENLYKISCTLFSWRSLSPSQQRRHCMLDIPVSLLWYLQCTCLGIAMKCRLCKITFGSAPQSRAMVQMSCRSLAPIWKKAIEGCLFQVPTNEEVIGPLQK